MNHEPVIGKYTLESLTNGMYASPLDLYREYIQNAVDSIDAAIAERLERPECFEIAVHLDPEKTRFLFSITAADFAKSRQSQHLLISETPARSVLKAEAFGELAVWLVWDTAMN